MVLNEPNTLLEYLIDKDAAGKLVPDASLYQEISEKQYVIHPRNLLMFDFIIFLNENHVPVKFILDSLKECDEKIKSEDLKSKIKNLEFLKANYSKIAAGEPVASGDKMLNNYINNYLLGKESELIDSIAQAEKGKISEEKILVNLCRPTYMILAILYVVFILNIHKYHKQVNGT